MPIGLPNSIPIGDAMWQSLGGALGGGLGSAVSESAPAAAPAPNASQKLGSLLSGVKFERGGAIIPGMSNLLNMEAFAEWVKRQAQEYGAKPEDIQSALRGAGINFSMGADGKLAISGKGGSPNSGGGTPAPATGGGLTIQPSPSPGGTYSGGGGGSASGGSSGRTSQGSPWGGGGGGGGGSPAVPGVPNLGGAAGGGAAGLSWNDPLGFSNPGPGPGALPGSGYAGGGFSYGKPRSIFEGLPANPTYGDVVASTLRRQEENRDAALGIMGNARNEIMGDPNRAALRGRVGDLLANPYSLDEATISRILGKTNEGITQRAAEMGGIARDRAAAGGVLRSGSSQAAEDAIRNNAASQMASGERDIRVQAAIQNQQDLRSAMGAALPVINEETTAKTGLDTTAARDILGQSSFTGDAFLSAAMAGKQNQPQTAGWTPYSSGYRVGPGTVWS